MKETLQKNVQEAIRKIKYAFEYNKITLIIIVVVTIGEAALSVLPYDCYSKLPFDVSIVLRAFYFLIIPSLFMETCLEERKAGYVCGYVIAFILSGVAAACMELDADAQIGGFSGMLLRNYCYEFLCGIFLLFAAAILYKSFKKTGLRFEEYAVKVFHNCMKFLLIYFVVAFGVMFVCTIIEELFFEDFYYLSSAGEIMVLGFYFAPKLIWAVRDMDEEPGMVLQTIVKYILPVLTICAAFIVYLYMLKILLQWQLPSNEIFSIVSVLFCLGLPVWIMARYYADETRYSYALSILPYVFAPLICLQIYSLGLRISQYGMTPDRYMGVMLIVFEAGMILIWRFRKTQCEILLPFFGILVFCAVFVPGINRNSVSNMWQMSFLKEYYQAVCDGEPLSELACERLTGAYDYLRRRPEMTSSIAEYNIYEESFMAMLQKQEIETDDLTQYDAYLIHCCQMVGNLDVSGYSQMSMLNQNSCYDSVRDGIDVDFSRFQFIVRETGDIITADLSGFAEKCMEYEEAFPKASSEETSDAMKEYYRIELDADTVLYVNHFEIKYYEGIKDGKPYFEWRSLNIGAMLLQK